MSTTTKIEQLRQRKAKIELAIARETMRAKSAQRKEDDRRKILVGAFVIEQLAASDENATTLQMGGKRFAEWLTRESDRVLFGLPQKFDQARPEQNKRGTRGNVENT